MLPSKSPSSAFIQNFKQIEGILREISLFKKYMKNIKFSHLLFACLVSDHVIFTCFISIKGHKVR